MERKNCDECNGKLERKEIEFSIYCIKLGKFPAEVCTKCGEEIFDEKTSENIDKIAKERGLWGLARRVKIKKIGNALVIKIPKAISEFLGLKEGKETLIRPDKNKIVIEN